jgi:hypothetical protein
LADIGTNFLCLRLELLVTFLLVHGRITIFAGFSEIVVLSQVESIFNSDGYFSFWCSLGWLLVPFTLVCTFVASYLFSSMSGSSEVVLSKLRQARLGQRFENVNSSAKPS